MRRISKRRLGSVLCATKVRYRLTRSEFVSPNIFQCSPTSLAESWRVVTKRASVRVHMFSALMLCAHAPEDCIRELANSAIVHDGILCVLSWLWRRLFADGLQQRLWQRGRQYARGKGVREGR